jgi:hypothetical protein
MSELSSDSRRRFLTQAGLAGVAMTTPGLPKARKAQRLPRVLVARATPGTTKSNSQNKEGEEQAPL